MSDGNSLPTLVELALTGDDRAWAEIVDRFAPLVWSVCRRFRLAPHDTDDVAQAVWLRLLDHLGTVRTPDALPGWLATTTRRECLRHVQAASVRVSRESPSFTGVVADSVSDEVEELVLQAEERDALRAGFRTLGDRCRQLLTLLLHDPPLAYTRIATELAMPVGSIGPTRSRCLDNLRRAPQVAALLETAVHAPKEGSRVDQLER